jgi:hypothetical protein
MDDVGPAGRHASRAATAEDCDMAEFLYGVTRPARNPTQAYQKTPYG